MTSSDRAVWHLFLPSTPVEQDSAFRSVLVGVLHTALRQCGTIGLVGILIYVGFSVLGLGYELHWTYRTLQEARRGSQVVLVGVLIVAALSVSSLVLAETECSLRVGRLFGFGAVLLTTAIVAFEGALRGAFNTEYVVAAFLLIVTIIPFYPPQVLGIGGAVGAVLYLLGPEGLVWGGPAVPSAAMRTHLAFVGGISVLVTGASAILYLRHRAFSQTQTALQKSRDLLHRTQQVGQIEQVGGWEYLPSSGVVRGTDQLWCLLGLPAETDLDLEAWLGFFPSEVRQKVRTAVEGALKAEGSFALEVPYFAAEGDWRWGRIRGKAHQLNGQTVRLTGTLQDITELKVREQELQQERDRLATLFESLPTPVVRCTVEEEGTLITDANEAFKEVFGLEATAVEGKEIGALLVPEERWEEAAEINRRALEEGALRAEVHRETAGGLRDFRLQVAGRKQKKGSPEIYAIFTDITEQKRREEKLKEAKEEAERMNRLKSSFLANMSHEIRTPLTSIIGFSEAISEEVARLEERVERFSCDSLSRFAELIEKGGKRLLKTLDAVLNLSKLEAGEMELSPEPIDVGGEAKEAAREFGRQAQKAGIQLHVDTSGRPLRAWADEGGVQIVLHNLVSNAIKYTGEGGQVWIRAWEQGGRVALEVEDTGIGMDPSRVEELFEAFTQESEGIGREYEGSGLGLAVTKKAVDRMDGSIEVETQKGAGSRFTVRFPCLEVHQNGHSQEAQLAR